jgi:hypothetical protein
MKRKVLLIMVSMIASVGIASAGDGPRFGANIAPHATAKMAAGAR